MALSYQTRTTLPAPRNARWTMSFVDGVGLSCARHALSTNSHRLAVLPAGTANVQGIDLDLPRDVDGLLELVRARCTQAIDVADVNGHLSFLVTGVGFDGLVTREVEKRRRGPITKWSSVPAVLRSLPRPDKRRARVPTRRLDWGGRAPMWLHPRLPLFVAARRRPLGLCSRCRAPRRARSPAHPSCGGVRRPEPRLERHE